MGFQLKTYDAQPESLAETNWDQQQNPNQAEDLAQDSVDSSPVDVPVLRRAAMDFLARREHSFQELEQKLQRKFPDENRDRLIEVVQTLADEGLQSDDRFAESWIRYRKSRGFGFHHIRADLRERGITTSLIENFLFDDDDCWAETALRLVDKRLLVDEEIEFGSSLHKKMQRYLESRGFGNREIQFALKPRLNSC